MTRYTRADSAPAQDPIEPRPHVPLASGALPPVPFSVGERFAASWIPLAKHGGGSQLGVNLIELPPGKVSCPFHHHLREEEHFYVLSGQVVLRSGDDRHPMAEGDYVCFPAGTGVAHAFENPHGEPCRLLAIGTQDPAEVAVYPDSGKAKLRATGTIVPWPQQSLDYWAGEPIDRPLGAT